MGREVLADVVGADRQLAVAAVGEDGELDDRDLATGEVGDPPAQALGERNAARVDADESDLVQLGVAFDDLVRDPGERPVDGLSVEQDLLALRMRHAHAGSGRTRAGRVIHTPFRPHGTGLKGFVVWRDHTAWNGRHPSVVPQPALEPGLYGIQVPCRSLPLSRVYTAPAAKPP